VLKAYSKHFWSKGWWTFIQWFIFIFA